MWRRKSRPAPEELVIPDDLHEARKIREETRTGLIKVQRQDNLVQRMTDGLIDRQGKNHYIELLYQHVPGAIS